jgi:hypothetical protein
MGPSFGYDDPRQFFIVKLAETLVPGQQIRISIGFLGNLNDDLSGFYRSSYFDEVNFRSRSVPEASVFSRSQRLLRA